MGRLTAAGVRSAKPGRHADGDGLYLLAKPTGGKSWVLRIQMDGRRRDIGLGAVSLGQRGPDEAALFKDVPIINRRLLTLAEAREKSDLLRRLAKAGCDPIAERDKERTAVPTFKAAAEACHSDLQSGWTPKSAAAFLKSLQDHAFGSLGQVRVDQIESSHIRDTLAPIWTLKPETARKLRQRIGAVLHYSKSKGWRSSEVPGKSVTMGLARRPTGRNFSAMGYEQVPAFVREQEAKATTVGRLALLFTIHTAARSGEVRQARWDQIDREKKLWIRPAAAMKSKVAHAVTLTDAALRVLDRARELNPAGELIFPSGRGTALSDMTLSKIMRDAKVPYTVHGFRSSFRDFAAEQMPSIPDAVAEAALAHVVPDKVERAYRRAQFLEMRRKWLEAWADHLAGRSNVLRLVGAAI